MRITTIMYLPLFILIFFGGVLQVTGVLSPTLTDIVVLVNIVVALYFCISKSIIEITYFKKIFFIYIAAVLYLCIFTIYALTELLVYIYYLSAFFLSISYGYLLSQTVKVDLYKFTIYFLIFEVIITTIQALFPDTISSLSLYPIAPIDAVIGSFYVGSDTGLCLFVIGLNVLSIYKGVAVNKLLIIFSLSFIVLLNANSKAFYMLFFLLPLIYMVRNVNIKTASILLAVTVPVLLPYVINIPYVSEFYWGVIDSYDRIDSRDSAHRFIIIAFVQFLDFSFFGDGLLTYYNPINKEWLFNAGFNTYLTILVDIGIAGILWVATFLTLFIYTATKKMPALGGYWVICLIVYLFVGFIFSNVLTTFIFSYVYFKLIESRNSNELVDNSVCRK